MTPQQPTTDPEREQLAEKVANTLNLRKEDGRFSCVYVGYDYNSYTDLDDEVYELVDYIIANYIPASQATPKPAVPGEGEQPSSELQQETWELLLKVMSEGERHKLNSDILTAYHTKLLQLLASQATAAQEREIYRQKLTDTLRNRKRSLAYHDAGGMWIANPRAERAELESEIASLESTLASLKKEEEKEKQDAKTN